MKKKAMLYEMAAVYQAEGEKPEILRLEKDGGEVTRLVVPGSVEDRDGYLRIKAGSMLGKLYPQMPTEDVDLFFRPFK